MTNLEQSFADLCARHGLLNAGLTYHAGSNFSISLQWPKGDSRGCVIEHGDTIADALAKAVAQMQRERGGTFIEEAMPEIVA